MRPLKAWQRKKINRKRKLDRIKEMELESLDKLYDSIREKCNNEYNIMIINPKDIQESFKFLKDNRFNNNIREDLKNIIELMLEYFKHQDRKIRSCFM